MLGNQLHSETSGDGRPRPRDKSNWRSLSATLVPSIVVWLRPSLTHCLKGALLAALVAAAGLTIATAASPPGRVPHYSIQAIRFADSPGDQVAEMVIGAPPAERIDTVYALWLIRGGGRAILFDSGFHRPRWFKEWTVNNYLSPDDAVRLAGVEPAAVTDIVISHAHWDHLGGIDLFPNAVVWIQKEEFRY